MKSTYLFILLISCTSCLKYQYATISSSIKKESSGIFNIENDTVKLSYSFSGENGPVKISLYNKLNTPLYIDWSKSAFIIGDKQISYSNISTIQASINSSEIQWTKHVSSSTGSINGTITNAERISFIPPKSSSEETLMSLQSGLFKMPSIFIRKKINYINVKSYSYDQGTSPLVFRSFLTLSVTDTFESPQYFDHSFWVSEIIQTTASPRQFTMRDDQFHVSKPTGAGVVVGLGILTGLLILDASGNQ